METGGGSEAGRGDGRAKALRWRHARDETSVPRGGEQREGQSGDEDREAPGWEGGQGSQQPTGLKNARRRPRPKLANEGTDSPTLQTRVPQASPAGSSSSCHGNSGWSGSGAAPHPVRRLC